MMPTWLQVVLGTAALVTAVGVIWKKIVAPMFRIAKAADVLVPLLRDFMDAFEDSPEVFLVLNEIAAQFRTDSGSSLRDVVNRLDKATHDLTISGAAAAQLSADDRLTLARLVVLLDVLDVKADTAGVERAGVAHDLVSAQAAVDAVATALAASEARADAVTEGDPGEAADAASRTEPEDP